MAAQIGRHPDRPPGQHQPRRVQAQPKGRISNQYQPGRSALSTAAAAQRTSHAADVASHGIPDEVGDLREKLIGTNGMMAQTPPRGRRSPCADPLTVGRVVGPARYGACMTSGTFTRLRGDIETDLAELSARGSMTRAEQLVSTGKPFNTRAVPQYFVGYLDAKLVMVMLNPGGKGDTTIPVPTVEGYLAMCRTFGSDHFGPHMPWEESAFDDKQVEFFRPFGRFDFEPPSEDRGSRQRNRVTVLDGKLQLELIPYLSPQLKLAPGQHETLLWHLDRVIETVIAAPRDLVIFTGAFLGSFLTPVRGGRAGPQVPGREDGRHCDG
jgi:hypothetical protein